MLHLNRLSEKVNDTGMTAKNLSIVWAPNLLRTPLSTYTNASESVGVSIKVKGGTGCDNGKIIGQPSFITNNTIINQDTKGNNSYNCAGTYFWV